MEPPTLSDVYNDLVDLLKYDTKKKKRTRSPNIYQKFELKYITKVSLIFIN